MTDEAIEVMRTLWREPVANFQGQFYQFNDALFFPKPGGNGPPLWIGGRGPSAIHRAARFGIAWVPFGIGLDDFRAGVALLRELKQDQFCPMIAAEMVLSVDKPGFRTTPQKSGEPVQPHIAGPPEAIAQHLDKYHQAGLEYLICGFAATGVDDRLRQMQIFAEQVGAHFTKIA